MDYTSDPQAAIQASLNLAAVSGVYDADTLEPWLRTARTQDNLETETGKRSLRWGLRALAATVPDIEHLHDLAVRLHAMVSHANLTVPDYQVVLQGRTGELDWRVIQEVGRCLAEGLSYAKTSDHTGLYRGTIKDYDQFLGLTVARRDRLVSQAITMQEAGDDNVRRFARRLSLTHYEARTIMEMAANIRKELA